MVHPFHRPGPQRPAPSSAAQSRPHRLDGAAQRFDTDHLAVEAHSEHIMRKVHSTLSMLAVPSRIARTLSGQPVQVAPPQLFIMPSTIPVTYRRIDESNTEISLDR